VSLRNVQSSPAERRRTLSAALEGRLDGRLDDQPARPPRSPRPARSPRPPRSRRDRRRRVRVTLAALAAVIVLLAGLLAHALTAGAGGPGPSRAVRARLASVAESQLGYTTDPANTYCNRFSAYWRTGQATCGDTGNLAEEWCSDFAAWVWRQVGVPFTYGFGRDDIGPAAISFYRWGLVHGTWHPVGSGYVPKAGDVAVYGLDRKDGIAAHVAVVIRMVPGDKGPNVVNGDGDRTGFSVVERGRNQSDSDTKGNNRSPLAGYTSPLPLHGRGGGAS